MRRAVSKISAVTGLASVIWIDADGSSDGLGVSTRVGRRTGISSPFPDGIDGVSKRWMWMNDLS